VRNTLGDCLTVHQAEPSDNNTGRSHRIERYESLPNSGEEGLEKALVVMRVSNLSTDSQNSTSNETSTSLSSSLTNSSEYGDQWLASKKAVAIDRAMAWFKAWLGLKLMQLTVQRGVRGVAAGTTESSSSSSSSSTSPRLTQSLPSGSKARKRPSGGQDQKGDQDDPDGDDDRENPDSGIASGSKKQRMSGEKLACPFFKHNPSKYRNMRGCVGPGWGTTHRLK
jgi:hypothetical protein